MSKQIPAVEQFVALGLPEADWTEPMRLAVKQKWSGLPVDQPVKQLRDALAAVTVAPVSSVDVLAVELEAAGVIRTDAVEQAGVEHKRLKRNAAVNAWRERNKLQAALDARDLKFAALRAKRGSKVAAQDAVA